MYKKYALLIITALLLSFNSVFAEDAPYTTVPMTTILNTLKSDGVIAIKKIDYSDDIYTIKAVTSNGQFLKLTVSPQTGKITNSDVLSDAKKRIEIFQAIKNVEAAGYTHIYEVKTKHEYFKVKAVNKKDQKVTLEVNATTGKISQDSGWF